MSIKRCPLCNLRFADDIDLIGGSEAAELQNLTTRLEEAAGANGMEFSPENQDPGQHTYSTNNN